MMSMSKVASLALAAVSLCESEAKFGGSKARPLSQFRLRMRERATHAAEARARSPMPSLIPRRTQRDTMKQCETTEDTQLNLLPRGSSGAFSPAGSCESEPFPLESPGLRRTVGPKLAPWTCSVKSLGASTNVAGKLWPHQILKIQSPTLTRTWQSFPYSTGMVQMTKAIAPVEQPTNKVLRYRRMVR